MAFNINAHVILQGPKNISAVTKSIRSQLQNINVNVGINVPKTAQTKINTLNKQLSNLSTTNQKLTTSANSASSSVKNMATSAKSASNAMQILGKETALTFKRFAAAGIVTATFFRMTQAISEAVPKALEFERGLNKLEQITGSTRRGLDGLAKTVDNLARSFGKDANEILEVAQIFAQTGQSIKQVEASVRAVARSSLAPTFGEMKQTAEGLVAALNQFGISARDSEKILGSLNRVSKKFAVESDDLIAAIRRAGGVFAMSAGQFKEPIDALNEFTAIFTAVRSTTRETAETVATGLRTIFSRIQRRGTLEVLKGLGIELTDTNGKFKGLFESFRILSKELDGLVQRGDAVTLSAITEELGGIRQIGKLIPAIRNFNKAERAFAEAAQGASEGLGKDVAKGLEPLIVQFEKVQQRFNSVVRTISNSSTFQALAKTAIGLANAFLSVAESLTPILPIIAKLAAFKLSKGAASFFQGFFGSARGAGGAAGVGQNLGRVATGQGAARGGAATSSLATAIKAMNTAVGGLSKVTSANTAATNSLNTTIKALQGSVGALNSTIRAKGFGRGISPVVRARGGRPRGFASGGLVPGTGNYDTVPAMLTPGEFVIKKSSVSSIGAGNLSNINKYATGGRVIGSVGGSFGLGALGGLKGTRNLATEGRTLAQIESEGAAASGILKKQFALSTAAFEKAKGISLKGRMGTFRQSLTKDEKGLFDNIRDGLLPGKSLMGKAGARPTLRKKLSKLTGVSGTKLSELSKKDAATFLKQKDVAKARVALEGGISTYEEARREGARLVAKGGKAYGLNASARTTFGRRVVGKIPGIISSASAGMGKDFAYEANTPLSSVLDTGGLNSLNGLLFEAFVKSATRDIAGGEQNAAFDIMAGDIGKLGTLFKGYRNPTELKNLFADKQINSTYNKAVRSFGASFDPSKLSMFAKGGMASGSDTVPAMLTPGEFVINRKSAQSIGYGALKTMNSGGSVPNGVKGYASGGIVEEGRQFYGRISEAGIKNLQRQYPGLTRGQARQMANITGRNAAARQSAFLKQAGIIKAPKQAPPPRRGPGIQPSPTTGSTQPPVSPTGGRSGGARPLPGRAPKLGLPTRQLQRGLPNMGRPRQHSGPQPLVPGSAPAIQKQLQAQQKAQASTAKKQTKAIQTNTKAVQKSAARTASGQGLMTAAFVLPDLLFTIPMVTESFKQMNEGVEGAGAQLTSALLSVAASAIFLVPAFLEMKKNRAAQGAGAAAFAGHGRRGARGLQSGAGRAAFATGFSRGRAQGPGFRKDVFSPFRNVRRGLRGAGGGVASRAFGGPGLTSAAIGPAIAGAVAIAVTGPIVDSLTGVSQAIEEISPGIKGARGESIADARSRGAAKGGIQAGIGAATVGFILGGPIGAGIGALIGSVGGSFVGGLNAEIQAVKFQNLVSLTDASKQATEALEKLGKDTAISANDISRANRDVDAFLGTLSVGSRAMSTAESQGVGGIVASGLFGDDDAAIISGSSNKFVAVINAIFDVGMNEAEEAAAIEAAKLRRAGAGFAIAVKAFDPALAEQSTKTLAHVFAQLTDNFIKGASDTEAALNTVGGILATLESTDSRGAQQAFFDLQETLRGGELGEAGKQAADTIANDFSIQLIAGLQPKMEGLSQTAQDIIGGALAQLSDPSVLRDPEKFNQALLDVRAAFAATGQEGISLNSIFNQAQKEAIKLSTATAQGGLVQGQYSNMINKVQKQTEAIVSSLSKLTNVYEQAANTFDVIIGSASDTLDSILSGTANFKLEETPNPFENLDLTASSADFQARIQKGFDEINAAGAGAAGVTSGLEAAPAFAANFNDFLRDTLGDIETFRAEEIGGKAPTQGQVTKIFEDNMAAAGLDVGSDLGKLLLGDIEAALFGATKSREGGTQISTDVLRKALLEDADLLDKFGENVKEITGELAKQRDLARKIAANDLRIIELQRKLTVGIRDLTQKNRDIDKRVGEITGTRTGGFAEADTDIRARIGLITGDNEATSVGALAARQAELTEDLRKARADEKAGIGGPNITLEIGQLESNLADNTDALKTLADDTTRLTAIQEQISKLQAREASARQGALGVFQKFGEAENLLGQGDFEGAAKIFQSIRADFAIVSKLQTGAALSMGEAGRFLSGELNDLLTSLGADENQIATAIDKGFQQVPGVLSAALKGIGVTVDPKVFAENLNMDDAIAPLKTLAEAVGDEQKKANQAIMDEIKNRAAELFTSLTDAQKGLRTELDLATTAVADFKAGLIEEIENPSEVAPTAPTFGTREQELARLGGGIDLDPDDREDFLRSLSTGPGSQFGFSQEQIVDLTKQIRQMQEQGIDINLQDVLAQRRKAIQSAGFDTTPAAIKAARQSVSERGIQAGGSRRSENLIRIQEASTEQRRLDAEAVEAERSIEQDGGVPAGLEHMMGSNEVEIPQFDRPLNAMEQMARNANHIGSIYTHDTHAEDKLDEQNKLTKEQTKKADKRFPPRRSAFDTNNAGTASGSVKSAAKAANELSISRGEVASLMNKLEKAAVDEFASNAAAVPFFGAMDLGRGRSSLGAAGDTTAGLSTEMQDALARIRQENRDPAGVDPLAGKTAEQLQKMSAAMFEAKRELIAFQKGLKDASKVTDQEVRDSIMRNLSPEERVQKVTNEMLEANMVREGQFGGMQRQSGMQAMIDKMRTDPSIGLQSDEERLAAETAFRDKASRAGIVSGRVGAQSRAAIRRRHLEEAAARLDPTATGDLQKDAGFTVEELVASPEARRRANEQRPFEIAAAEREARRKVEQAREDNTRAQKLEGGEGSFDLEISKAFGDAGVVDEGLLAEAVQQGKTSFGRFGTREQEFSGLKGDSTSRATTAAEQKAFLQDLFTREAVSGEKVDFDSLTADALGIDKAALDKLNREEQNKRLSKITAAPGTAEFDAEYDEIVNSGFLLGRNFVTKDQRDIVEHQLRNRFDKTADIKNKQYEASIGLDRYPIDRGDVLSDEYTSSISMGPTQMGSTNNNALRMQEQGMSDEEIRKKIAEARRKQFAGAKAAAIARKGGAKTQAAAPVQTTSGDAQKFREEEDAYNARLNEMHAARTARTEASTKAKRAQGEISALDDVLSLPGGYSSEGLIDTSTLKNMISTSAGTGDTEAAARYQDILDTKSGKEQRQKVLKLQEEQRQRLQQAQEEEQAAQQRFNQAEQNLGERPTAPASATTPTGIPDWMLPSDGAADPGKASSMSSSAYETEQKEQAGLLAGVPGARGNFRKFGTGVRGRGSVDPQNYISGAAKKSMMRGKSFVTRAGSMGQYMDPRTGKTFNYDELSGSARKAIQSGTSKLVKKPTVKPQTKGAGDVNAYDVGAAGAVDPRTGNIPGTNYPPQGSRPGGFRTPEEMGISGSNAISALTGGAGVRTLPYPQGGGAPAPQAGGAAGIMGPDAIQAMNSLAGALNNLGGQIELKITEPVEIRLDQGNLMGEIKKVVAEAVKNSASSALSGNGSQMQASTTTSPTPN